MMELSTLDLFEKLRVLLQHTESIENYIGKLEHKQLRKILVEMLGLIQADIYTYLEFVATLESCENEYDIHQLLRDTFPDIYRVDFYG